MQLIKGNQYFSSVNHTIVCWNYLFQCTGGSPPVRLPAGCHHAVCLLQKWEPNTTSAISKRTSDAEAARAPFSWTTEYLATAETDARKMDRRLRRGLSSGSGTSRANGRGSVSWTGNKRDGTVGKGRAHVAGAETWGSARTSETVRSCMTTTAVKTCPRLFTRSTKSPTTIQDKFKSRSVFMTLYPQPGLHTKDTLQVLQALICIQLSSSRLFGHGSYIQGSGGGRKRIRELARATRRVLGMNWRDYWTWCRSEPGEPPE